MKIRIDRLEKIAEHLEKGELAHKVFDFRTYNSEIVKCDDGSFTKRTIPNNKCGTHGCAVGEFPVIFPENFDWNFINIDYKVRKFLNIDMEAYRLLFVPAPECVLSTCLLDRCFKNVKYLPFDATKEMVAENIRNFIEYVKENNL